MKTVCLYFQVHQPWRLKKYRFFNMGKDHNYLDDLLNRSIMQKVARQCYLPMNALLLKLIRENLKRTRLQEDARVVRSDYLDYLSRCREQYDIIFLDPPYAEVFLENSLNRITEIDILHSGGIIVAERPLGKELPWDYPGYTRSRDYPYGKILLTFYRKDGGSQETI